MSSDSKRVHLMIKGNVQGVFFRSTMRDKAESARVNGWVKNRSDGSVEAVLEGPSDAVDTISRWAHDGPPQARVSRVEEQEEAPNNEFQQFRVVR
ncbi:MAG: acylphosphatase [Candidatus Omnitrophota bacterium]